MITNDEMKQAEAEVERAQGELTGMEKEFARGAITTHSHTRLGDAQAAAEHASVRLNVLRAEFGRQQSAREAREAAGRAAAASMTDTVRQLTKSRDAAVQALAEAEAGITRALAAVGAHDRGVRAAAAELSSRGLRADDGEATGGRRDGGLLFEGEHWLPVDGPSLLAYAFASLVAAADPRHPLGRSSRSTLGNAASVAGRDDLLARVPGHKS